MSPHRIGSRGSDLALWQSRTVLAALEAASPSSAWRSDITVITTRGDVDQSPYLAGSVEKGFFTRELEVALLDRRIDLVVHSLKDLPTAEPQGLVNRTILPRASAADWLLIRREFHEPRDDGLHAGEAGLQLLNLAIPLLELFVQRLDRGQRDAVGVYGANMFVVVAVQLKGRLEVLGDRTDVPDGGIFAAVAPLRHR